MEYLAFYWTLPVHWAGHNKLPLHADDAAKRSQTIRYQVERVRRWVKDEKGHLAGEEVFMESRPDRGTDVIQTEIRKLLKKAKKLNAQVVLVDFAQAFGWRPHGPLFDMIHASGNCMLLPPEPALIEGKWWNPVDHFRAWRDADLAHQIAKESLNDAARAVMTDLKADGASYIAIAAHLNSIGQKTVNGRAWTADNVRKFMAKG